MGAGNLANLAHLVGGGEVWVLVTLASLVFGPGGGGGMGKATLASLVRLVQVVEGEWERVTLANLAHLQEVEGGWGATLANLVIWCRWWGGMGKGLALASLAHLVQVVEGDGKGNLGQPGSFGSEVVAVWVLVILASLAVWCRWLWRQGAVTWPAWLIWQAVEKV